MNNVDKQYFDLLRKILKDGEHKMDRTGTGTLSIFDYTMRFNMDEGFPLLTSKKMFMKGVIHELIWFINGETNIKYLVDNGVNIWNGDAYKNYISKGGKYFSEKKMKQISHLSQEDFINKIKTDAEFAKKWGDLGPIYGKQWRNWGVIGVDVQNISDDGKNWGGECWNMEPIDQIANLINDLKTNPDSRRLMVNAWNVGELDQMVLPPCHYLFQCYTVEMSLNERIQRWCKSIGKDISYGEDITHEHLDNLNFPKRKLSLKWNQRSVDVGLGLAFNIASYALLLHLIAREVNMIPLELIFSGGDVHIYCNHIEPLRKQLENKTYKLPSIELNNKSIFDIKYDDIKIIGYESSPSVKMELSN